MKTFLKTMFLFCLVFFVIQNGIAQTPKRYVCGVTLTGFQVTDLNTCQTTILDTAQSLGKNGGQATFDHVHNRYINVNYDHTTNTSTILVIDANSGKLLQTIPLNQNGVFLGEIEYDDSNNTLYGFCLKNGFVSLNLTTNKFDTIAVLPYALGLLPSASTFDPVRGRYYDIFTYDSVKSTLGYIDIHTGALTFTHTIMGGSMPEYCRANGKIYGFHVESHSVKCDFVSYDPSRDTMTVIDTGLSWYVSSTTFDDATDRYIMVATTSLKDPTNYVMIDTSGNFTYCDHKFVYGSAFFTSDSISISPPPTYKPESVIGLTTSGLTRLDLQTCNETVLNSGITNSNAAQGESTFDHVHNKYIFERVDSLNHSQYHITVADANTGALLSNAISQNNMLEIEYDDSTNKVYGLTDFKYFVSLDMGTGKADTVAILPFTGFAVGGSTFDDKNGRYIQSFTDSLKQSIFAAVNVHTGSFTTYNIPLFDAEYCMANGKLYGLVVDGHNMDMVSLNLANGAYTVVAPNALHSVANALGTFDDVNNRYIIPGTTPAGDGPMVMIDTLGNVTTCTGNQLMNPEAYLPGTGSIHKTTYDTLKGRVTTSTGAALKNTYIYKLLYNISDSTLYADDSVKTDTTGHYQFLTNDSAVYLYASPDSIDYPNELGTYYDSSLTIQLAYLKALHTGTTIVNFNTMSGTNHSGGGFIGGKITICNCKKPGKGQPVPNLRVVLIDSFGNAVKQTYTNASGNFGFNNVGYGKYKIWVDYPKVDNSIAPQISISATAPSRTDNYSLYPTYLQIYTTTSILAANPETGRLNIYPNPFTQSTNIEYTLTANATITLKVYDITGREVANLADEMQTAGKYYFILDANKYSLPAGMYMIKLTVNGATNNQEIIKIK